MKTTIEITRLRLHAFHGVLEQERRVGNDFEVSVTVGYPVVIGSDELSATLNYAELVRRHEHRTRTARSQITRKRLGIQQLRQQILVITRLRGDDVIMIGGSDEHGVPITIKARREGVTPQDIVDRYHNIIKDSFKELGATADNVRRCQPEHILRPSALCAQGHWHKEEP